VKPLTKMGEAPAILKPLTEAPKGEIRPIIKALADPVKRKKLEAVYQSLKDHNVLRNTYYGCGDDPVPMEEVGELLECLSAIKQG